MFYWEPLHRSVRVEGVATKITAADSDAYFHSRPAASQIGAIVSDQSTPIESRSVLTKKNVMLEEKYLSKADAPTDIPRPDWWGGFDVVPESVEFWQGQSNRIHDRIVFYAQHAEKLNDVPMEYRNQAENGWIFCRLSP